MIIHNRVIRINKKDRVVYVIYVLINGDLRLKIDHVVMLDKSPNITVVAGKRNVKSHKKTYVFSNDRLVKINNYKHGYKHGIQRYKTDGVMFNSYYEEGIDLTHKLIEYDIDVKNLTASDIALFKLGRN